MKMKDCRNPFTLPHFFFSPNEGELEDHLKMLLDYFFDTHNAIKEYMNQLGNTAVAEEEKKERVKVKGICRIQRKYSSYRDKNRNKLAKNT